MGLLDCVGDKAKGKYPVNPQTVPLTRGTGQMSSRRSLGFGSKASNTNIKGRDIEFWWHRTLVFLYGPEGREDVGELKIPLKQFGFNSIGDFIKDIPARVYEQYQNNIIPENVLRKDYKVIFERDGVAEPGMFKWEGIIDDKRCMGLQLDRKKAVPFGIHDGKGLFYCKPGHRALVLATEVYSYKQFLRQFIGIPRKDSMSLNLLPGRSSVRVAVAKQYKPGDRVHLPTEGKWATILWTGRIGGEWVVDLVYDPEKPATGKMASPDEPCMSRSLSMAEFIDQLGDPNSQLSPTPPKYVPPPPPKTPDLEDEVFIPSPKPLTTKVTQSQVSKPKKMISNSISDDASASEINISDEEVSTSTEYDTESEEDESKKKANNDPGIDSEPESEVSEGKFQRTFSEPIPGKMKSEPVKEKFKGVEKFENPPLKSRPTHKPLFNLASFGRKKKENVEDKKKIPYSLSSPPPTQIEKNQPSASPSKKKFHSPRKDFGFFDTSPTVKEPDSPKEKHEKTTKESSISFFRKDKSRSPVSKKSDRKWSREHQEVAIDVPQYMRSPKEPKSSVKIPAAVKGRRKSSPHKEDSTANIVFPEPPNVTLAEMKEPAPPLPLIRPPKIDIPRSSNEEESESESNTDLEEQSMSPKQKETPQIEVQVEVKVETNQQKLNENEPSEDSSDSSDTATPPYSPSIKDVGLYLGKPTKSPNQQSKGSAFKKPFGSFFSSSKKKPLPPKDYEIIKGEEEVEPKPPSRKESLELDSEDSFSESSEGEEDPEPLPKEIKVVKQPKVVQEPQQPEETTAPKRQPGLSKISGGFFSRKPKDRTSSETESIQTQPPYSKEPLLPNPKSPEMKLLKQEDEQLGDQEGLILECLEVKDDIVVPASNQDSTAEARRNSSGKGKKFSFGFSKKFKPVEQSPTVSEQDNKDNTKGKKGRADSLTPSLSSNEDSKSDLSKSKRNSFRNSFTRTFSFTKDKRTNSLNKYEKLEDANDQTRYRPTSSLMYIDNNEAIGATDIDKSTKSRSKSTSVLVDIQPWDERRGLKKDPYEMYDSPSEDTKETKLSSSSAKNIPAALQPKNPEQNIPKHRIFTTPKNFFGFSHKSNEELISKPKKKTSFKENKIPKSVQRPSTSSEKILSPLKTEPPAQLQTLTSPPPKATVASVVSSLGNEEVAETPSHISSVKVKRLKSALKKRKEIGEIPKGIKIGDRVVWYNGRVPVPGNVLKLYKDGTDKYTAVVKFDRITGPEPLSLTREGDAYIVTVEELITPEVFGLPSISSTSSPPQSPLTPNPLPTVRQQEQQPPQTLDYQQTLNKDDDKPQPVVRFDSECKKSPEPIVPEINVQQATPVSPKEIDNLKNDEIIPPPFQEEEIGSACGLRRGIPSRDNSCCLETILFSMFYTSNAFDISVLFHNGFEEESLQLTREVKSLLRHEVVYPLRSLGYCEWMAILKLKDLMENISPDFNNMSTDAEIMTLILFERTLKLGKFISYSTNLTDYLHQLIIDPKDHSKSTTIQEMFENSLEHMDNAKLKTVPTPALILEIPRVNDKLERYEAIVPNLNLNLSHLVENGPRLCICGMVGKYECEYCSQKSGPDAIMVFCDNCKSMADQIHFKFDHDTSLVDLPQISISMDLTAVICVKGGHYTSFVKCGTHRTSPWLFYDAAEKDNPKVSLEQNLGMWIDRLEKYPGKYQDAFIHPLLTHFLSNSHICIYKPTERSSLV